MTYLIQGLHNIRRFIVHTALVLSNTLVWGGAIGSGVCLLTLNIEKMFVCLGVAITSMLVYEYGFSRWES